MTISDLPHLNAALNATSTVLLITGWILIKRRRIAQHRLCMITAVIVSSIFFMSYGVYHGAVGSKPFPGSGAIRTVYYAILIPHVILAVLSLPPILITFARGLRRDDPRHRKIARWTMPIWLFVSVTGVIVYVMLYQWF